jgi:hypothetical protein
MTAKLMNADSGHTVGARLQRTALFGITLLVAVCALRRPSGPWVTFSTASLVIFSVVIALVYLLVDRTAVKFRFGRVSSSVTVVEIPLIGGLLLLNPFAHVIVRVFGQGLGIFLRLRKSKNKQLRWVLLVHASQGGLEVFIFSLVADLFHSRSYDLLSVREPAKPLDEVHLQRATRKLVPLR